MSNGDDYGTDYSLWPPSFKRYVEAWFGTQIIWKLTQSKTAEEKAEGKRDKLKTQARSQDAFNGPTRFLPPGRFRLARSAGYGSRGDGGYRGRLIG